MTGEKKNPTVRQQKDHMPPWAVYSFTAFLAMLLIAGFVIAWATKRGTPARMGWRGDDVQVHPVPRDIEGIKTSLFDADLPPLGDWDTKRVKLSTYEWADPSHTTVRIPIERAMDVLVKRGHVE